MNPRLKAYTYLFFVALIWGIAGPVIKVTVATLPPDLFLFYRFFISAVIALFYFLFTGAKSLRNLKSPLLLITYCLLTSSVTLGLLFWGTSKTSLLDMSILHSIGPLIIIVSGYIFLKDHITKKEFIGIGIAFLGTLFVMVEPILKGGQTNGQVVGNLLILASLFTNAVSAVLLKLLLKKNVKPLLLSNLSFLIGFVSLIPLMYYRYNIGTVVETALTLSKNEYLGILYMSVFSGTLAYTLGNMGQKTIEISEAALFSYLYPIFSAILAVVWLKEVPTPLFIAGSVVIAIGVVIAETKHKLI